MKLETTEQDVIISGDFETSDFKMGDISFVVDMFADKVYTNKERAVIRELSCNAHDAHVAAGTQDTPFEIQLPSILVPVFKIRDYGTGLSDEDIRGTFAGIGISTKRNSNEMIGCFGIGSLSPYSLCDQFTVTSWYDGKKSVYTCYRDSERKPVVARIASTPAPDEPCGLEISMTVKGRSEAFQKEAIFVFKHWSSTLPVINDLKVVEKIEFERKRYVFSGSGYGLTASYGTLYAVMGNIAYEVPEEMDTLDIGGYIQFELGELNFDTARENLSNDDKTRLAVAEKIKQLKVLVSEEAKARLESLTCKWEQACLAGTLSSGRLSQLFNSDIAKYHLPRLSTNCTYWQGRYRGVDESSTTMVSPDNTANTEYYLDAPRMKHRIRAYVKAQKDVVSRNFTLYVLTPEQAKECHIPANLLKQLTDLPKISSSRTGGIKSDRGCETFVFQSRTDKYCFHAKKAWREVEITDKAEKVFVNIKNWVSQGYDTYTINQIVSLLPKVGLNSPEIYGLKGSFTKTKKFTNGNFITLKAYLTKELNKLPAPVKSDYCESDFEILSKIYKHTKDSSLERIMQLQKQAKNSENLFELHRLVHGLSGITKSEELSDAIEEFFKNFPMINLMSRYDVVSKERLDIITTYIAQVRQAQQVNH